MISSIGAYYLFSEKMTKLDIGSLVIGFLGVLLILLPKSESSSFTYTTIDIILIITLPFQMSTLQLFIRQMKDVHYAIINFYYTLVSAIGYGIVVIIQSLNDTTIY